MLRHIGAVLALPFMVTIIIPALIVTLTESFKPGWGLPLPLSLVAIVVGVGLIAGGLVLVVATIRLFMTIGQGTLAPWDPTERLVVEGVYRYVRNPMISAVIAVLLGEAALLGSPPVLIWALLFTAVNLVYIPRVEEPGLRKRFGADYAEYAQHVPRWLPRRTPWRPSSGVTPGAGSDAAG
jgi:protein-S-isoprenylcysteine O-methyltransferase Ste14